VGPAGGSGPAWPDPRPARARGGGAAGEATVCGPPEPHSCRIATSGARSRKAAARSVKRDPRRSRQILRRSQPRLHRGPRGVFAGSTQAIPGRVHLVVVPMLASQTVATGAWTCCCRRSPGARRSSQDCSVDPHAADGRWRPGRRTTVSPWTTAALIGADVVTRRCSCSPPWIRRRGACAPDGRGSQPVGSILITSSGRRSARLLVPIEDGHVALGGGDDGGFPRGGRP